MLVIRDLQLAMCKEMLTGNRWSWRGLKRAEKRVCEDNTGSASL